MRSFEIENIKLFTSALFASELFDTFCVTQANFTTTINVTIDGHLTESEDSCAAWKLVRPLAYEVLKGDKLPAKFKIVLMTPPDRVEGFLTKNNIDMKADEVNGLFLNIIYENGKLACTSGVSLASFSLDKSLENAWDESVGVFLKKFA